MFNSSRQTAKKTIWEWLQSYWCDPNATPELTLHYRVRQIDALARQLPLASAATCFVVMVCFLVAYGRLNLNILVIWSISLLIIALCDLLAWYLLAHRKITNIGSQKIVFLLSIMLGLAGIFYAIMTVLLFGILDHSGQLLLVAIVAAFISTGAWQFAVLPAAGVTWVFTMCIGIAIGLIMSYGLVYILISLLLIVYWIYLTFAVLVTSQRFVFRLMAETSIEQQRQVVGLLLRDFENNASDWLWEVDAQECLIHVSPRMESVIGIDSTQLLGRNFTTVLSQRLPGDNLEAKLAIDELEEKFLLKQPFSQIHVAIQLNNKIKWWSLTAKPLFGEKGNYEGWRGVGTDVTDARLREQEMIHFANIDTLTGLANRHLFVKTLRDCFPEDTDLANIVTLITLDLDKFKAVNDLLGHLAGDELLKEVAYRLRSVTPAQSLLARLGGDEFAWVIPNGFSNHQAEEFGEKVRSILAEPWTHQEHSFYIGASIGVANAPNDGKSPIALQRASDMALYSAKANGRNTLCFFDTKLDEYAMHRLALLNDLRHSLASQEFRLLYQPQIRFSDGALVGFEALVRWHHPLRGIVSPTEFIPLTEENGLIVSIGEWVLHQACSDAMSWPRPFRVAVNVSSIQIDRSDLLTAVNSSLISSGLPANRLELELTESSLMQDGDTAISLLKILREIGVRIALDDFGTGYSSLSYLQKFPIDKLKVDQSFVLAASVFSQDQNKSYRARSILIAILQLAQALGLDTIAEGVETEEMAIMLNDFGFQLAQGYFYSRPMTLEQTQQFIIDWPIVIAHK